MILQKSRKAMTLVELIISMTILATIAAIAVISAEDMGEISRYDETDRRGKLIQNALVGYDTPRFIQDMGRLPLSLVDLTDSSLSDAQILSRQKLFLAELIDLEADSALTYSYKNAKRMKRATQSIDISIGQYIHATSGAEELDSDISKSFPESVSINAGWAGPYALSGKEALTDNWGKPWDIYHLADDNYTNEGDDDDDVLVWATPVNDEPADFFDTNDKITLGTEIQGIRSIYKEDYSSELSYKFPSTHAYANLTIQLCDSSGNIIPADEYNYVRVFLYLPYCPIKTYEDGNLDDNETNYPAPKIAEVSLFYNKTTNEELKGIRIRHTNSNTGTSVIYNNNFSEETEGGASYTPYRQNYPDFFKTYFNEDNTINSTEFALENVPIGTRKIWAFAYKSDNAQTNNSVNGLIINECIYAPLQNIKITKDTQIIQLRLSETFN